MKTLKTLLTALFLMSGVATGFTQEDTTSSLSDAILKVQVWGQPYSHVYPFTKPAVEPIQFAKVKVTWNNRGFREATATSNPDGIAEVNLGPHSPPNPPFSEGGFFISVSEVPGYKSINRQTISNSDIKALKTAVTLERLTQR